MCCEKGVQQAESADIGGADQKWWVARRRCETELYALAAMATMKGQEAIHEWLQRRHEKVLHDVRDAKRGVDRKAYTALGKNMQLISGVQEIAFMMIETKNKCKKCQVGN